MSRRRRLVWAVASLAVVLLVAAAWVPRSPAAIPAHEHSSTPGPAPEASAGVEHAHGVDPFSAALLLVDGVVALTVVVLLLRRPRRS